jgi:transcriptional regulator NrdR family protein
VNPYNQMSIPCPSCGSTRSEVTVTRSHDGRVYRRRRCKSCSKLYTTIEQYSPGWMADAIKDTEIPNEGNG